LLFIFIGPGPRYLPIFSPFIALVIAVFILNWQQIIKQRFSKKKLFYYLPLIIIIPIVAYEIFYNVNTNLLYKPIGIAKKNYSNIRAENNGYNELEKYLKPIVKNQVNYSSKIKRISKFNDTVNSLADVRGKDIFIYDSNLKWFSTLWYFQRYTTYHDIIFVPDFDLADALKDQNWFEFFYKRDARTIYFIKGSNNSVYSPKEIKPRIQLSNDVENFFIESLKAGPFIGVDEIKNRLNQTVFKIYHIDLNNNSKPYES
jgi:hypothetical protein